ncbi:MAG: Flp family type IVb pilin [Caldilineaceae bacterium]|nr:Flp family type IVb pilin [Caldilineaceae bacterium]MCB9155618.1 Flp family type IVb pilin [Caldilineaceae bacterium]
MFVEFVITLMNRLAAVKNEEGQGMAEYALIIALVAIVLAASLTSLQGGITNVFSSIVSAFGV